jgi:hypothetical protein
MNAKYRTAPLLHTSKRAVMKRPINCGWEIIPVFLCWGKNNARIRIHLTIKVDSGYSSVSVADPGCLSRIRIFSISDPNFFYPGSAPKNLSILNPKIVSKLSRIWSWLFIPDPDPYFFPIPDPGVKRHRIPDSYPQHCGYFVKVCIRDLICFPRPFAWMAGPPVPVLRPANLNTRFLRSGSASSCEPFQLGKHVRPAMIYLQFYDGKK